MQLRMLPSVLLPRCLHNFAAAVVRTHPRDASHALSQVLVKFVRCHLLYFQCCHPVTCPYTLLC